MYRTASAATAAILLACSQPIGAATINVPAGQPTIQAGINAANTSDVVLVAPGTYNERIDLMGKAITVRSSGGPNVTTINGGGTGSTVVFDDDEANDTIVEGFTITGGTGTSNGVGGNEGGGLYCFLASPTVRSCIVTGNTAIGPGSGGGGMSCFFSSPRVINCLFYDNTATTSGGAIFNESGSSPFIVNSTFADNTALTGGGIFSTMSTPRLISCIAWLNNDDAVAGGGIVTYSNIQTGFPGEGNINQNPSFVNLNGGNLSLNSNSVCIDAGDSTAIATELAIDLNNEPRGVDAPGTADTGKQVFGLVVDMGAYEFQSPCEGGEPSCAGDITDSVGGPPDGTIDVFDLVQLLQNWGPCPASARSDETQRRRSRR
jgi:predicted outer membrane repeat protein